MSNVREIPTHKRPFWISREPFSPSKGYSDCVSLSPRHLMHDSEMEVGDHDEAVSHKLSRSKKWSMCTTAILLVTVLVIFATLLHYLFKSPGISCGHGTSAKSGEVEGSAPASEIQSDADMDSLINSGLNVVIMFHAPWCGHCKMAMPNFLQASSDNPSDTQSYTADCHNVISSSRLQQLNIKGFPTILKFKGGNLVEEYRGDRTKQSFLQFMN